MTASPPGPRRVSRRIGAITESATLAVDARAKVLRAAGESVIGFGAGEPDFPTPTHIWEAAARACADPRNHHYSPTPGLADLRTAIALKTTKDSGFACDAAQVVVTNGAKHALYSACQAILDDGDEVLLPAPYWTTYPESITLAGAAPVVLATDAECGFRVTVDQLERARTARTKAMVFVSPNNPTGVVYPRDEVEAIGRWAAAHGIWVITDEIYEHLTYGDATFSSMPAVVPELAETCIVLNGVSKTYAMTGWRVGWMIAPPDVARAAINFQSHTTSHVNNVAQAAALAAVTGDLSAVAEMRAVFGRRGARMYDMLSAIAGVECLAPQGAFYCFPSFAGLLGREIAGHRPATTVELCEVLLDEARVALVPGEAFGAPGYARLSFALGDDDLVEGVERIAKLIQ